MNPRAHAHGLVSGKARELGSGIFCFYSLSLKLVRYGIPRAQEGAQMPDNQQESQMSNIINFIIKNFKGCIIFRYICAITKKLFLFLLGQLE